MSTEYFYIKESTKELFDLGNGGHYYDLYELILKKIRSFQKSGTSIDVVKEKLKPYILEEFQYFDSDITEDDSYLCFFVERVIPALLNWIDDTTNLINDYELVVSVEKEFGKEFCENFYEENHKSYVDQVYKTVGSIYEDETFENGIIDRSVTFDRVLIELKHGKTAYRKSKPNIIFGLLPNGIFSVNDYGVILIKTDDILANDWIVVD